MITSIIFWFTVVVVLSAIVALAANQYRKLGKPFPWELTLEILVTVGLLLAIAIGVRSCSNKFETEKVAAQRAATNTPPAAPAARVINTPSWTFKTFSIPASGMGLYLYPGWKDWPKGGAITITTPSGQVLHDQPGVINRFGDQPEGIYIFIADPVGEAREVQIYNRW